MCLITDRKQIEGIFTVLVGVAFLLTFPESTSNPVSRLKYRYFNERETQILTLRILRDDPSKAHASKNVKWVELKAAVSSSSAPIVRLIWV